MVLRTIEHDARAPVEECLPIVLTCAADKGPIKENASWAVDSESALPPVTDAP